LQAAMDENQKAINNARRLIQENLEEEDIVGQDAEVREPGTNIDVVGAVPVADDDPDFWPPHLPTQYHQMGALGSIWAKITGLFT